MLDFSVFRAFFLVSRCTMRCTATTCGGLLHRILHRLFEVCICDLKIVLLSHLWAVPHPLTNNVRREGFLQFRLPAGTHVLEQLWPGLQPGPLDDLQKCRAQVLAVVAIAGDDEFRLVRLRFPRLIEESSKSHDDRLRTTPKGKRSVPKGSISGG